jgi:hypothetical protein
MPVAPLKKMEHTASEMVVLGARHRELRGLISDNLCNDTMRDTDEMRSLGIDPLM